MFKLSAACHCGNIVADMRLPEPPGRYRPRACDCDFCLKHGAAYVSDVNGSLQLQIRDERLAGRYRQGSEQAQLLLCRQCGVLVAVLFGHEGRLYGAVNARAVGGGAPFGPEQRVSPRSLAPAEKAQRWQELWFQDVILTTAGAS